MSEPALRPFRPELPEPPVQQPTLFDDRILTIRQVRDWYFANLVRNYNATALLERRRIWDKFCAWVPDESIPTPALGEWPYNVCRPFHLLEFLNQQSNVASAWSRKRWASTIQTPLNKAAKLGHIGRNPFQGLTFPEGDDGRDLTPAEFAALLRLATPYFRRVLVFLRFSGARPGELKNCQWKHVNFEVQAIVQKEHKTAHTTRDKKPRMIRFNQILIKLLIWLKRHQPAGTEHVFLNAYGAPWTTRALCKNLFGLREKAGLPADAKLYGCRHAFATWAILNGLDVATLAELLGHKHLRTTERYVHLAGQREHLNKAAEAAVKRKR
jgi:integrase